MRLGRSIARTVAVAAAAEGVALALGVGGGPAACVLGLGLHGWAASWALRAAELRAPLSRAERDLVLVLALGLPVLGVLAGWIVPRPLGARVDADAHEAFEDARAGLGRHGALRARELGFSGRWADDVRARLDVESHLDVLRFGDRTLRGNLVQKLAQRGAARDLELLRRVLEDPDEELRIQAFLYLREARSARLEQVTLARERAAASGRAEDWLAAAREHFKFAESGALDPALVHFELQRALEAVRRVRTLAERSDALALELQLLGRLGAKDEAERALASLRDGARTETSELASKPDVLVAWAEVAFRASDLRAVREAAQRLTAQGEALPSWLAEVASASNFERLPDAQALEPRHAG